MKNLFSELALFVLTGTLSLSACGGALQDSPVEAGASDGTEPSSQKLTFSDGQHNATNASSASSALTGPAFSDEAAAKRSVHNNSENNFTISRDPRPEGPAGRCCTTQCRTSGGVNLYYGSYGRTTDCNAWGSMVCSHRSLRFADAYWGDCNDNKVCWLDGGCSG